MRSVICCWSSGGAADFESKVPLLFAGRRNARLGFSNEIDLLFLSGLEALGEGYRAQLRDLGYVLHDGCALYEEVEAAHPGLRRFNDYEKKCFLRWPVLFSHFGVQSIIHYDGDLVFNEDPRVIGRLLKGRTFVLQGCPALTCLENAEWSSQYLAALTEFSSDVDGYSARAWKDREGWESTEHTRWAGSRFRQIISHDQDLISHLIHTDRIVQEPPAEILRILGAYMLFENPLYMHAYETPLERATYRRQAGIDYVNEKRPLLWHMQADFTRYLSEFVFRRRYLRMGGRRMTNHLEQKDWRSIPYQLYVRRLRGRMHQRAYVYRYFFADHDFSDVLTGRSWWKEGVFA